MNVVSSSNFASLLALDSFVLREMAWIKQVSMFHSTTANDARTHYFRNADPECKQNCRNLITFSTQIIIIMHGVITSYYTHTHTIRRCQHDRIDKLYGEKNYVKIFHVLVRTTWASYYCTTLIRQHKFSSQNFRTLISTYAQAHARNNNSLALAVP